MFSSDTRSKKLVLQSGFPYWIGVQHVGFPVVICFVKAQISCLQIEHKIIGNCNTKPFCWYKPHT